MARVLLAFAVCIASIGCGGPADCKPRSGSYRVEYTAQGGNCGAQADQITAVDDTTPPAQVGCGGTRTKSADNCEVTANQLACPATGARAQITGTLHWNSDSSQGTGALGLIVFDASGAQVCQGTYEVVYTRL